MGRSESTVNINFFKVFVLLNADADKKSGRCEKFWDSQSKGVPENYSDKSDPAVFHNSESRQENMQKMHFRIFCQNIGDY